MGAQVITDEQLIQAISEYLEKNIMTWSQLADELEIARENLSRWRSGRPISRKIKKKLVGLLMPELIQKEQPSRTPDVSFDVPPAQFAPLLTIAQAASIQPTALGLPIIEDGETSGFINVQQGDFAVVIAGRSMMPWYPPGTHVLVRRSEVPKNGDRVVAMLADSPEPVFKVFIDKGDHFTLLSINEEDGLPPIHLNKMDREEWYWCYPIVESKRNERALDAAMRELDLPPFWQRKSIK